MTIVDRQTADKIRNALSRLVDADVITSHRAEIITAQLEGREPSKFVAKSFSGDTLVQLDADLDLLITHGFITPEWANVRRAVKLGLHLQRPAQYVAQPTTEPTKPKKTK